jgi:hypothetical protein
MTCFGCELLDSRISKTCHQLEEAYPMKKAMLNNMFEPANSQFCDLLFAICHRAESAMWPSRTTQWRLRFEAGAELIPSVQTPKKWHLLKLYRTVTATLYPRQRICYLLSVIAPKAHRITGRGL